MLHFSLCVGLSSFDCHLLWCYLRLFTMISWIVLWTRAHRMRRRVISVMLLTVYWIVPLVVGIPPHLVPLQAALLSVLISFSLSLSLSPFLTSHWLIVHLSLSFVLLLSLSLFLSTILYFCLSFVFGVCWLSKCWETFIGQQFYRLGLTNMAVILVSTLVTQTARKYDP